MPRHELVTAPTVEPLFLEDGKDHLHEDGEPIPQDTEIESRIQAARELVENETGRALITQTWKLYLDRFPCPQWLGKQWDPGWIHLPRPPIQEVLEIEYVAADGTPTVLNPSQYVVQLAGSRRHIRPAYGVSWPVTRDEPDAVRIEFDCGYGDSGDAVPESLRNAIRLIVGDLYENREGQIVGTDVADNPTLERLISKFRVELVA